MNLATEYLRDHGETVEDWDGICGELADRIGRLRGDILYVEGDAVFVRGWSYHIALLRDGFVHDAWCEGDALPPRDWLIKMFGKNLHVEVSLNGDTIFAGPCRNFQLLAA